MGLGIGAVAFLLVAIPILQTGVVYADNDHHDHQDHHHFHHFFHDIRFFRHHLDNHQINLLIRELEHIKRV